MNDKILTIVIPAYNMEQYIIRCLESVTVNIRGIDDLEIIVVNDGSKDRTLELAQTFAVKYPQSVRVIDKPNGGWGTGINRGIDEATGKYLKTLDSDDWFDSHNLDEFIILLKQLDVDMVLTSLSEVNQEGDIRKKIYPKSLCGKIMPIDDYLTENNYSMGAPIHSITYRTSLLKDSGFRVCDRFYGDLDYIITPLIHVNTVYLSTLNIYQYFISREGQSVSIEGYNTHIDDYLEVCRKTVKFWIDYQKSFSQPLSYCILKSVVDRIKWAYILLLSPLYSGNKPESKYKLRQLDHLIKTDRPLYSLTNRITVKKIIPWIYVWRKSRINILKLINKK